MCAAPCPMRLGLDGYQIGAIAVDGCLALGWRAQHGCYSTWRPRCGRQQLACARRVAAQGMFQVASSFNQPVEAWDVGQVTDMSVRRGVLSATWSRWVADGLIAEDVCLSLVWSRWEFRLRLGLDGSRIGAIAVVGCLALVWRARHDCHSMWRPLRRCVPIATVFGLGVGWVQCVIFSV